MVRLRRTTPLEGMILAWKHRGCSFWRARQIWLYCQKNNKPVPEDVLKVFEKGILKDHDDYILNHHFPQRDSYAKLLFGGKEPDYIIYLFVSVLNWRIHRKPNSKRISKNKAFDMYADLLERLLKKRKISALKPRSPEAIKQAYYNMKTRVEEKGETYYERIRPWLKQ